MVVNTDKDHLPPIYCSPDYYMGIGTPGGNKIPTTLNEVLVDYLRAMARYKVYR